MFTPEQAGIVGQTPADEQAGATPPLSALNKACLALLAAHGANAGLVGLFGVDLIAALVDTSPTGTRTLNVAIGFAAFNALMVALHWAGRPRR